jgi:hypothetical protein
MDPVPGILFAFVVHAGKSLPRQRRLGHVPLHEERGKTGAKPPVECQPNRKGNKHGSQKTPPLRRNGSPMYAPFLLCVFVCVYFVREWRVHVFLVFPF